MLVIKSHLLPPEATDYSVCITAPNSDLNSYTKWNADILNIHPQSSFFHSKMTGLRITNDIVQQVRLVQLTHWTKNKKT